MNFDFVWDDQKYVINKRKHGVSFDLASRVFFDPLHYTRRDRIEGGEYRWQTIGHVDKRMILFVAHTVQEKSAATEIRIISARQATKREKDRYYEQIKH